MFAIVSLRSKEFEEHAPRWAFEGAARFSVAVCWLTLPSLEPQMPTPTKY